MIQSSEVEIRQMGAKIDDLKQNALGRRLRFLERHCIDAVLDVGANEGQYALELRKLGYAGRIHSFEPVSAAYKKLSENAKTDSLWETSPVALGEKNETQRIHVSGDTRASSLMPMLLRHLEVADYFRTVGSEEITVRRLDDMVEELLDAEARIFLKIDAQGYEEKVLEGARKTLGRAWGVQLELSLTPLYEGEPSIEHMIRFMREQHFVLHSLEYGFTDPETGQMLQVDGIFGRQI